MAQQQKSRPGEKGRPGPQREGKRVLGLGRAVSLPQWEGTAKIVKEKNKHPKKDWLGGFCCVRRGGGNLTVGRGEVVDVQRPIEGDKGAQKERRGPRGSHKGVVKGRGFRVGSRGDHAGKRLLRLTWKDGTEGATSRTSRETF